MKVPQTFSEDERDLDQLVIAADCAPVRPACDLLFIHANDLLWGGTRALIDLDLHPEAIEHFTTTRQLINTRLQTSLMRVVRACLPFLDQTQALVAEDGGTKEARELALIQQIA